VVFHEIGCGYPDRSPGRVAALPEFGVDDAVFTRADLFEFQAEPQRESAIPETATPVRTSPAISEPVPVSATPATTSVPQLAETGVGSRTAPTILTGLTLLLTGTVILIRERASRRH